MNSNHPPKIARNCQKKIQNDHKNKKINKISYQLSVDISKLKKKKFSDPTPTLEIAKKGPKIKK